MEERRVKFDFEVDFSNGGGIQGQDFRLDIDGENIADAELARYIVRDMRLLMVGNVRILNKEIITEKHRRTVPQETEVRGRELIDVSHQVEDGMITYNGLPAPIVCDYLSREESRSHYAEGTEFHIGKIEMVANTGTYMDAPFHRFVDGKDLSELPLSSLANLDTVVVRHDRSRGRAIDRNAFEDLDLADRAVLVNTGWDANWRTDAYFEGHPFLTGDAAEYLADSGAALVGIDSYNIDNTDDGHRPVHTALLGAEIPIVEHMRGLDRFPDRGARFFAVPVKVKDFGTFPVRAFGLVER
ncbi:MAG TPA: cyclase family protein [Rubrobacteraceae bacterium]|nr:cyclase family protein [Rubrobacteraceae bacterium]